MLVQAVSPFLDPVTRDKIKFVYAKDKATHSEFVECFGKEVGGRPAPHRGAPGAATRPSPARLMQAL